MLKAKRIADKLDREYFIPLDLLKEFEKDRDDPDFLHTVAFYDKWKQYRTDNDLLELYIKIDV